jgi:hypothetical protein
METGMRTIRWEFDWRWIVAGYCYLVLFHLLPTYLLGGYIHPISPGPESLSNYYRGTDPATFWMLFGVVVVSFVVAYRSRGFTVFEPAVAGVLYAFTTAAGFREIFSSNVHGREALVALFWLLIVVILTTTSAWMGEIFQARKEKSGSSGVISGEPREE